MDRTRRRLSAEDRRLELLDLGLELFAARAVDDVSVEEIASAGEVSPGLLYHHFGSKRGYYLAVVQHSEATTRAVIAPRADDDLHDLATTLRTALLRYFDHVERTRSSYVSIVRSAAPSDPDVAAIIERSRRETVDQVLGALGAEVSEVCRASIFGWTAMVEEMALRKSYDRRDQARAVTLCHKALDALLAAEGVLQPRIVDTIGTTTRPLTEPIDHRGVTAGSTPGAEGASPASGRAPRRRRAAGS